MPAEVSPGRMTLTPLALRVTYLLYLPGSLLSQATLKVASVDRHPFPSDRCSLSEPYPYLAGRSGSVVKPRDFSSLYWIVSECSTPPPTLARHDGYS